MSKAISKIITDTIIQLSNKGPRYIILEIDCPGGQGIYLKEIAATVSKTDNCPVIAFITGGPTGGAFSAAAAVALACDVVFIAPDAIMGTFAPVTDLNAGSENAQEIYTPASLASYGTYIAELAEKNGRNGALAAAMLDTSIEIVEVSVDISGTRKFINKTDKQASDAIIRTWSKATKTASRPANTQKTDVSVDQLQYQITMTAQEALHARMANKIVNSRGELLTFLGASDAKIQLTSRIDREIKTFGKNKLVMEKLFSNVEELEIQEEELETSLEELRQEAISNQDSDAELRRTRKIAYEDYQRQMRENNKRRLSRKPSTRNRSRQSNVKPRPSELRAQEGIINQVDPYLVRENIIRTELAGVLNNLLDHYKKIVGIGRKYPGTVPEGKSLKTVEDRYSWVHGKLNSGYF